MNNEVFSLDDAIENKPAGEVKNYHEPGIYENVVITDVKVPEVQGDKKPYIILHTKCAEGYGRSRKMYLTAAAWPYSARQIVSLIQATTGKSEADAKAAVPKGNAQALAAGLSALILDKPVRGLFYGERRNGRVYTELMYVESMKTPRNQSKLKFDAAKHIKDNDAPVAPVVAEGKTDDLPF
jgi:hypothetical protein